MRVAQWPQGPITCCGDVPVSPIAARPVYSWFRFCVWESRAGMAYAYTWFLRWQAGALALALRGRGVYVCRCVWRQGRAGVRARACTSMGLAMQLHACMSPYTIHVIEMFSEGSLTRGSVAPSPLQGGPPRRRLLRHPHGDGRRARPAWSGSVWQGGPYSRHGPLPSSYGGRAAQHLRGGVGHARASQPPREPCHAQQALCMARGRRVGRAWRIDGRGGGQ